MNTTTHQLYDYIKERIYSRSYLEKWEENKNDYNNDPKDVYMVSYNNRKKIKESGTVESTSRIINSIINDEDSDMPDSLNNNKTSQIDIKMIDITLTL